MMLLVFKISRGFNWPNGKKYPPTVICDIVRMWDNEDEDRRANLLQDELMKVVNVIQPKPIRSNKKKNKKKKRKTKQNNPAIDGLQLVDDGLQVGVDDGFQLVHGGSASTSSYHGYGDNSGASIDMLNETGTPLCQRQLGSSFYMQSFGSPFDMELFGSPFDMGLFGSPSDTPSDTPTRLYEYGTTTSRGISMSTPTRLYDGTTTPRGTPLRIYKQFLRDGEGDEEEAIKVGEEEGEEANNKVADGEEEGDGDEEGDGEGDDEEEEGGEEGEEANNKVADGEEEDGEGEEANNKVADGEEEDGEGEEDEEEKEKDEDDEEEEEYIPRKGIYDSDIDNGWIREYKHKKKKRKYASDSDVSDSEFDDDFDSDSDI
jgi:hypothetical protein